MQYKIVTLYSSVFSYLVCCFVHTENHCSAAKVAKTPTIARAWQQYFTLLSAGSQACSTDARSGNVPPGFWFPCPEWKCSTRILVPLPVAGTKQEMSRLHKAGLGQGRRARALAGAQLCLGTESSLCAFVGQGLEGTAQAPPSGSFCLYRNAPRKHSSANLFQKQFGCETLKAINKSRCPEEYLRNT